MRKNKIVLVAAWLGFFSALSVAQAPVPFINQPLMPGATAPGGPEFTLTINGTNFVSNSVVNWNGNALLTHFVNSSHLTATVPASNIATATTAWVTVANPAPGGGTSNMVFSPITIAASGVEFSSSDVATGAGPLTAATGDFNGDGKLDLVVSNNEGNSVSILLGNGDGTFRPHVDYAVGSAPSTVLVGDFNGDGVLDLAVRNESSNTVSILQGNGDGTFQAAHNFGTGNGHARMIAADFNRDGHLDLVTTNDSDGTVSILLGNGDGTFQNHVDYATGSSPIPIAVGDLNGDGKLDLIVGNVLDGDAFAVLLGNGDGTFQSYVTYPTIYDPESLVLADFNGDGKLDLAVFSETGGTPGLVILLGNGDGTFRSFADYPTGCGSNLNDCTASSADLNGDGMLDLVVRNSPANTVQVLQGNGDGTFQNPLSFPTGGNPEQVVVGDFNGDGRLDLAVANLDASFVSLLLQPGPAVTVSPSRLSFGSQLIPTASIPQKVALTNAGASPLNISGIVTSANFYQKNNCGSSLSAGATCPITVIFRPTGMGVKTGTLTISDNGSKSPQTVALSGVGTVLSLSTTSLNFGNQAVGTTGPVQTITLTSHAASRVVPISGISIKGANVLSFAQTNTCGTGLAPGASCTFSVTFTPQTKGSNTAMLYVGNGGGDTPEKVTLSGHGT